LVGQRGHPARRKRTARGGSTQPGARAARELKRTNRLGTPGARGPCFYRMGGHAAAMADIEFTDVIRLLIPLLAAVLFVFALMAYRRRPTARVLLFASAFGVYFVKGVFLGTEIFIPEGSDLLTALTIVADAVILLLFFLGMVKG
jgi:hypothetical protein